MIVVAGPEVLLVAGGCNLALACGLGLRPVVSARTHLPGIKSMRPQSPVGS